MLWPKDLVLDPDVIEMVFDEAYNSKSAGISKDSESGLTKVKVVHRVYDNLTHQVEVRET